MRGDRYAIAPQRLYRLDKTRGHRAGRPIRHDCIGDGVPTGDRRSWLGECLSSWPERIHCGARQHFGLDRGHAERAFGRLQAQTRPVTCTCACGAGGA